MSVWIEIHCDRRIDARNQCGEPRCHAHSGAQPGAMAHNSARAVTAALRELAARALAAGYRKRGGDWTCPACLRKAPGGTP